MARTGKPESPSARPWLLLLPLPLTLGAAVGAACLRVSPPLLLTLWLVLGSISAGIVARAWRAMTDEAEEAPMPTVTVLSRVDALEADGEEIESTARGRGRSRKPRRPP